MPDLYLSLPHTLQSCGKLTQICKNNRGNLVISEIYAIFADEHSPTASTIMEALLHYVWQHRLFPTSPLVTTSGERVEVLDTGLHNTDAGPDFFNAKVRIGAQLWVGNVEIHTRASDWFRHEHQGDPRYNNVILHVVEHNDAEVTTLSGRSLPQLVLSVPTYVADNYHTLMVEDAYPPCHRILPTLPLFEVHAWLSALTIERLEQKMTRIDQWLSLTHGDWERVAFILLARAFGFGKNTDAFEHWAATLDPQHTGKHRDDPLLIEAFFFGQAGLLDSGQISQEDQDSHFQLLQREYRFLQQKFNLTPIPVQEWKFLRLRPQNFPHVRLAQLAALYLSQRFSLAAICQSPSIEELYNILEFNTLPYWLHRFKFGENAVPFAKNQDKLNPSSQHAAKENRNFTTERPSKDTNRANQPRKVAKRDASCSCLSSASKDLLLINAVFPLLFAYGHHHQNEALMDKAINWMETMRAERNHVVRMWQDVGIMAEHAADSQALLQLKWMYCDRHDCLRCRFGARYLQRKYFPQ